MMSWTCFLAETTEDRKRVGAVWEAEVSDASRLRELVGTLPNGRMLFVRIPGGILWSPHYKVDFGAQWQIVSGEAPRITVRPSISYPQRYHGWLTEGVLSDDLDGRLYDEDGRLKEAPADA